MALVQTHRFNWMGYEGTQSEALNLALLRQTDAGQLRYSDYQQRQQVVNEIELRLKLIKRDLGLLPQEDILKDLQDAEARRSPSPKRETYAEDILALFAMRRKDMRHLNVISGLTADDGKKFNFLHQPSDDTIKASYMKICNSMRSLLFRNGLTFVSYIDGMEFTELRQLVEYNKTQRAAVQGTLAAAGVMLPAESTFDVKTVKAALEQRDTLRKKLDALRARRDPTYAANCIRKDELNDKGEPTTTVLQADGDEQELFKKLVAAQKKLHSVQSAYNAQAYTVSQQLLKAKISRPARG